LKTRFEGKRLCDFDGSAAQNLLERIVNETPSLRSSNNVKHVKWFMVSVFNLAAVEKSFDENRVNPFFKVNIGNVWKPVQRERKPRPTRHSTLADVVKMIETLDGPASTAVAMAAFTGLRKSELQALKWEDLKNSQLHVRRTAWRTTDVREGQTKTEASAAPVPVIPILADFLEAHRNGFSASGFIFAGEKLGRPLDFHNLAARVIRPALAKKGIAWCGWHGFRRGLSTLLYELGTEAKTRQAILRHADVAVTERHYTQTVDAVSITAMNKVQKVAAPKLKKLLNAKIRVVRKVRNAA
jgi:integrase